MSSSEDSPAASDTAVEAIEDAEFGARIHGPVAGRLIAVVAASWSLFQLALPQFLLLRSDLVRSVHLAFALGLVYLSFPAIRNRARRQRLHAYWQRKAPSINGPALALAVDAAMAVVAVVVALHFALDAVGIGERQGLPILRDKIVGVLLVVLLLEAARRALGPALPVIAGSFILYSFVGERMPEIVSFKNATLNKVIGKLTMSTEGIYGVPLDVSASMVFLFVLFGAMLEKTGGGHYFVQLAFSLLGRFRGGPAKAAVLASGLTGMVSGSSIANTVTTGTFTIPLMKRTGYPSIKAAAIEVAASTNGQLMPPIMGAAAFIIAEYCGIDYLLVVKAALVPAVVSYLALIFITHLEACKLGLKGLPRAELPPFRATFLSGIHFLVPLAFLLYQLIVLRQSAERAAFYAILSLAALVMAKNVVLAVRTRQSIRAAVAQSLLAIWHSLAAGGRNMMAIGVAVAAAGIIVGIVTLGLGNAIVEVIDLLSGGNLILMLVVTALISLLLGMGLPTTANYVVMASLTVPAMLALGHGVGLVVPVVAAHLFCFYFGILADDTPPVGLAAYAAAAIGRADPIKTGLQGFFYDMRTAILPFVFVFNTDLLLAHVEGWSQWPAALRTLATAMLGMFAFAALTQNYLLRRNRPHESIALIGAALLLLLPAKFAVLTVSSAPAASSAAGIGLFAGVMLLQWRGRSRG